MTTLFGPMASLRDFRDRAQAFQRHLDQLKASL